MLEFEFDDGGAAKMLQGIIDRLENPAPALRALGVLVDEYEQEVFATSGNGRWPALAGRTIQLKGGSRMMVDTGELLDALTSARVEGDAVVATAPPYAQYPAKRRDPAPEPPDHVTEKWAEALLGHLVEGRA